MLRRMIARFVVAAVIASAGAAAETHAAVSLLNVSYDPTRELYQELNTAFAEHWKSVTGETIVINQSHGGSGKQARSVIDGLQADVVTLALASDIDAIARAGVLPRNWQSRLPHNSCPYTSTIVFLVRKGNPKGIKDWDDLARESIAVITPNPKTSGGARWNYLAAWGFALKRPGGDEKAARDLVSRIFRNVPILDTGARGSTITFVERKIGDVLIAWENEALFVTRRLRPGQFEIVVPSISIRAEPPVTVVDKVVEKRGTRALAQAYLEFLYTPAGQELAAKHYYRAHSKEAAAAYADQFAQVEMFGIDDMFGGWASAQQKHFAEGGIFDQIYQVGR